MNLPTANLDTYSKPGSVIVNINTTNSNSPTLATIEIIKNNHTWNLSLGNKTWPSTRKLLTMSLILISATMPIKSNVTIITNNNNVNTLLNETSTSPTNWKQYINQQDLAPYLLSLKKIIENKEIKYTIIYEEKTHAVTSNNTYYIEYIPTTLLNFFHIHLNQNATPFTARNLLKKLHKAENINAWLLQKRIQKWNIQSNMINWSLTFKNINIHGRPLSRYTNPSES